MAFSYRCVKEFDILTDSAIFFAEYQEIIPMRNACITLLCLISAICTATAFCAERETIRDATGKVVGTATTDGNRTVYRDATGKTTGTATTEGNRTTYRDATGKTVGTATESGNRTTYRDATGKTVGTATESGNRTT